MKNIILNIGTKVKTIFDNKIVILKAIIFSDQVYPENYWITEDKDNKADIYSEKSMTLLGKLTRILYGDK